MFKKLNYKREIVYSTYGAQPLIVLRVLGVMKRTIP